MFTACGSSDLAKLEDLKSIIRSLLIAENNSQDVTLEKLCNIYQEQIEEDIPYRDFGFTSLREFLASIPDVVQLRYNKNKLLCVYHVDSEKSKHISELISKQRKESRLSSRRTLILSNNRIDLHLLLRVLKEGFAYSTQKNRDGISKMDILGRVKNYIGEHSAYTHENLSSQLNEFTHLLTHDDDFIFFKPKSSNTSTGQVRHRQTNSNKRITEFPVESISDFIKDITQTRLRLLMKKHHNGIWSNDLPRIFQQEYKWDLKYYDLGFSSIIEFVSALPHIMKLITPPDARKQLIVGVQTRTNPKNFLRQPVRETVESPVIWGIDPIPNELSLGVSKLLISGEFMSYDDTIDQILVSSLQSEYIDVIVSDVKNPSWFWVNLRKNKRVLEKLMNELQEFYALQDLNKFTIPKVVMKTGLHVACAYEGMWHRGIIKKFRDDEEVSILFYDFGTVDHYRPEDIYFLDKRFSNVPSLAIPCRLSNVRPAVPAKIWPYEALKLFSQRVCTKEFVAHVVEIDKEHNFLSVNLIDTSSELDEEIDKWMFRNNIGKPGQFNHSKKNTVFEHYLRCLKVRENGHAISDCPKRPTFEQFRERRAEPVIVKEDSQHSPIGLQKKLEFLKKYKERSLNSSSSSNNESAAKEMDESNVNFSKLSGSSMEDQGYGQSPVSSHFLDDRRQIEDDSSTVSSSLSSTYIMNSSPSELELSSASTSRSTTNSSVSNNNHKKPPGRILIEEIEPNSNDLKDSQPNNVGMEDRISYQGSEKTLTITLQELQDLITSTQN